MRASKAKHQAESYIWSIGVCVCVCSRGARMQTGFSRIKALVHACVRRSFLFVRGQLRLSVSHYTRAISRARMKRSSSLYISHCRAHLSFSLYLFISSPVMLSAYIQRISHYALCKHTGHDDDDRWQVLQTSRMKTR